MTTRAQELCARCRERPGTRPRWCGDSSRELLCGRCDAAAAAKAAAWTPERVTHAAVWRCGARGCRWSMVWTASRAQVDRDLVRRIARAQMLEHARAREDQDHASLVRELWRLMELPPSDVLGL